MLVRHIPGVDQPGLPTLRGALSITHNRSAAFSCCVIVLGLTRMDSLQVWEGERKEAKTRGTVSIGAYGLPQQQKALRSNETFGSHSLAFPQDDDLVEAVPVAEEQGPPVVSKEEQEVTTNARRNFAGKRAGFTFVSTS
jgi:hypothetical protein